MLVTVMLSIVLGAVGCVFYQQTAMIINERRNYGKRLFVNRRACGRLVNMRFNGSKHYFYVDENYQLCHTPFSDKKDAIEACQAKFAEGRPKQSVFARIA